MRSKQIRKNEPQIKRLGMTILIIYMVLWLQAQSGILSYGAFAIERGETAEKNQIYVYMPNMIFKLK